MPHKPDEKLNCPHCKKNLTFLETDGETGMGGYYCKDCCMAGLGPHKINGVVVGRR